MGYMAYLFAIWFMHGTWDLCSTREAHPTCPILLIFQQIYSAITTLLKVLRGYAFIFFYLFLLHVEYEIQNVHFYFVKLKG